MGILWCKSTYSKEFIFSQFVGLEWYSDKKHTRTHTQRSLILVELQAEGNMVMQKTRAQKNSTAQKLKFFINCRNAS